MSATIRLLNEEMSARRRRWLTNMPEAESLAADRPELEIVSLPSHGHFIAAGWRLFRASAGCELVVLDQPGVELWVFGVLRWLAPWRRPPLALLDVVFTKPAPTVLGRLRRWARRWLWRRADLFVNYMRDVAILDRHYAILPDRCLYVPFKVNGIERVRALAAESQEGTSLFTGGRSRRDYRTFCQAMSLVPYPAILLTPRPAENVQHGTDFDAGTAPPNVRVVHDDGSSESWLRHMAAARAVVMCVSPESISPSGVGAYLVAMAVGKCVIITDCPATRGILTDGQEAMIVPQEDPQALAAAITRVCEDTSLRQRVAAAGRAYAMSLGGRHELLRRIGAALDERLNGSEKRERETGRDRDTFLRAARPSTGASRTEATYDETPSMRTPAGARGENSR